MMCMFGKSSAALKDGLTNYTTNVQRPDILISDYARLVEFMVVEVLEILMSEWFADIVDIALQLRMLAINWVFLQ
jgi:hypothetical protein